MVGLDWDLGCGEVGGFWFFGELVVVLGSDFSVLVLVVEVLFRVLWRRVILVDFDVGFCSLSSCCLQCGIVVLGLWCVLESCTWLGVF